MMNTDGRKNAVSHKSLCQLREAKVEFKSKCHEAEIIVEYQDLSTYGSHDNMDAGQYMEREVCSKCYNPCEIKKIREA